MSSILVRLPEPLRSGGQATIVIDEPVRTVGELISILEKRVPGFEEQNDELFNFAVNGEMILHGEKVARLAPGDEVEVLVAFAGG